MDMILSRCVYQDAKPPAYKTSPADCITGLAQLAKERQNIIDILKLSYAKNIAAVTAKLSSKDTFFHILKLAFQYETKHDIQFRNYLIKLYNNSKEMKLLAMSKSNYIEYTDF